MKHVQTQQPLEEYWSSYKHIDLPLHGMGFVCVSHIIQEENKLITLLDEGVRSVIAIKLIGERIFPSHKIAAGQTFKSICSIHTIKPEYVNINLNSLLTFIVEV